MATLSGKNRTAVDQGHEVLISFGEVPVQTTAEKWIDLHNFSPVRLNKIRFFKSYFASRNPLVQIIEEKQFID